MLTALYLAPYSITFSFAIANLSCSSCWIKSYSWLYPVATFGITSRCGLGGSGQGYYAAMKIIFVTSLWLARTACKQNKSKYFLWWDLTSWLSCWWNSHWEECPQCKSMHAISYYLLTLYFFNDFAGLIGSSWQAVACWCWICWCYVVSYLLLQAMNHRV